MNKKSLHSIKIEHFLFLRNIELEIDDFTLMIGIQSSGKSSVCKLIFLFRNLRNIFFQKIIEIYENEESSDWNSIKKEIVTHFNRESKNLYVKLFGESYGLDKKTKVIYSYGDGKNITLSLSKDYGYLDLKLNKPLLDDIVKLTKTVVENTTDDRPKGFFIDKHYHQKIDDELKRIFNDHLDSYYIPAGRNMFSLLQGQLATLQTNNFDYTNELFFFHLERFTSLLRDGLLAFARQRGDNEAEKIARSIISYLGGEIRKSNGVLSFVVTNDNNQNLLLKFISSGQQEVMWIFYLLFIWITCKEQVFVIIEEPEAHIHPTLQKEIMDFTARFINQTKSQVILTTHSPYILASANLLHYAGFLKDKGIKMDDIIPSNNYLTPKNCHFFEMQKKNKNEFTMQEIIEKDEDSIFVQVEKIDYVSNNIEEEFSKLFQREIEQ